MGEDWLSEKLAKLEIKETRASTLNEIRTQLLELTTFEQVVVQRVLNATVLYAVLNEPDNDEDADIATDILSMCLAQLSMQQQNAPTILRRAMLSPRVRVLALNAMVKELSFKYIEFNEAPHISDELVALMLEAVQSNETEVGMPAVHVLSLAVLQRLEEQQLKTQLLALLGRGETIRLRVYEIALNVGKVSQMALQHVLPVLEAMVNELQHDDILLQLNVLEMLTSLGVEQHGYDFLESRGVVSMLSARVEQLDGHPLDQLLVPGIMKFFGKIAYEQPDKIIPNYPHLLNCLFECLRSADISLLGVVFDTFANVSSRKRGKELLNENFNQEVEDALHNFVHQLRNLSSDLKVRGFQALQLIFSNIEEQSDISEQWFNHLSNNSNNLQFIMDYIRNPFPDLKVACLGFVHQLSYYTWGIQALRNTGGLVEYLLDRKQEFDKDCKYVKFEIIKLLDKSSLFDASTQQQLRYFVNQGAYYLEPAMDIATEGGGNSN